MLCITDILKRLSVLALFTNIIITPHMKVAIAAIIKNEAPYIHEWILFHIRQGIEDFILFDHESSDNTKGTAISALRLTDQAFSVTDIKGAFPQLRAYRQAVEIAITRNVDWLAFIDVDEFLFSPQRCSIPTILTRHFTACDAVVVHWMLYGSSNQIAYLDAPVRHRFFMREASVNDHVKTICRPKQVKDFYNPHALEYMPGALVVDENYHPVQLGRGRLAGGSANLLRINHYATKSLEECRQKCARGRADSETKRVFEEFFSQHDKNEVYDPVAMIF